MILYKLVVTNYGTSSTTSQVFSDLYLYENDTLITATTTRIGENTFVFKDFNYTIPSTTPKALTVKGDLGSSATSSQTIILGIDNQNAIKAYGTPTGSSTIVIGNFPILGNTFTLY